MRKRVNSVHSRIVVCRYWEGLESPWILISDFPGLESRGMWSRSLKVLESHWKRPTSFAHFSWYVLHRKGCPLNHYGHRWRLTCVTYACVIYTEGMFGVELLKTVQCCMRNDVTAARSKFIVDGHSLIGCCCSWKEVKQCYKVVESGVQRASSRSDCVDLCTVGRAGMTSWQRRRCQFGARLWTANCAIRAVYCQLKRQSDDWTSLKADVAGVCRPLLTCSQHIN